MTKRACLPASIQKREKDERFGRKIAGFNDSLNKVRGCKVIKTSPIAANEWCISRKDLLKCNLISLRKGVMIVAMLNARKPFNANKRTANSKG
jgi:hypothetical protein